MTQLVETTAPLATHTRRRLLALIALALPTLLVAVDISVMNIALPSIARDLRPSATQLLWITDSYNFLVAGSMLAMGALADRIGRRRLILICAAVFAIASALGAFATSPLQVIGVRALLGIAGSAIVPASMALIGVLYPEAPARMRAMGIYLSVFLGGMAVAPFVGGLLLDRFWWGSVFLIGVPVMLVTIAIVPRLLPESRMPDAPRVDLPSTAQSVAAILAVVYALKTWINDGADATVWAALLAAAVLGVLFVRRQLRLENPLVDLRLVASARVGRILVALFLIAFTMGGSSLALNLYIQEVQAQTPLQAAGWALPQMLLMLAAANVGPWLSRRWSSRAVTGTMLSLMAIGFLVYTLLPVTPLGRPLVAAAAGLTTFGVGALFPVLMDRVIGSAPPERAGAGAAVAQLSNELGVAFGLTLLGSLGTVMYRANLDRPGTAAAENVVEGVREAAAKSDPVLLDAVNGAFTGAFHAVGIACLVALAAVVVMIRSSRPSA
jgi:DHA2 family multidrug resistance protein-like MFS transporter